MQIMGKGAADRKQILMESMRMLTRGGVFAIQDCFDRILMRWSKPFGQGCENGQADFAAVFAQAADERLPLKYIDFP